MLIYSIELPLPSGLEVKQILELACKWIYGSKHNKLKKGNFEDIWNHSDLVAEAEGEKVEFGYTDAIDSSLSIGGIKFTRNDKNGLQWVTTIVSSQNPTQHLVSVQLSCELLNASVKLPKAKKPHFVKQLLKTYGGGMDGEIPVSDKVIELENGEESIAAALIQGSGNNILPIVYISHNFDATRYIIEPEKLAKELSGLAHIVAEPSQQFSINLKKLTESKNVYGGNIGVYWSKGNERKSYYLSETINSPEALKNKILDDIIRSLVNKRQTTACSWLHLQENLSKQRLYALKKNYTETVNQDDNVQAYIDAFDTELKIKERHLEEANKEILRLEAEVRKLSALQFSHSNGILNSGDEQDLYPFEVRSFVLNALKNQLERGATENSRQSDILHDLIKANQLKDDFRLKKREELKRIFNDYTSMTPLILNTLKGMGFTHSEDGKHHRFLFAGDDRYSGTTSKTSSDCRAGKNFASDISNKIF